MKNLKPGSTFFREPEFEGGKICPPEVVQVSNLILSLILLGCCILNNVIVVIDYQIYYLLGKVVLKTLSLLLEILVLRKYT